MLYSLEINDCQAAENEDLMTPKIHPSLRSAVMDFPPTLDLLDNFLALTDRCNSIRNDLVAQHAFRFDLQTGSGFQKKPARVLRQKEKVHTSGT